MSYMPTREEAQILLDDVSTPENKLLDMLQVFHFDLSVAEAVARHPNCPLNLVAKFMHYLPDAVEHNSRLPEYKLDVRWDSLLYYAHPSRIGRDTFSSKNYFGSEHVNSTYPEYYKVDYWLKNGSSAQQRMVLQIENIPMELIQPFLNSKQVSLRQTLAARKHLPEGGFNMLAKDTAKSVRAALAKNVCTPPNLVAQLALDPEREVAQAARSNINFPSNDLSQVSSESAQKAAERVDMACDSISAQNLMLYLGDPQTDSEQLALFASHPEAWVRASVGLHSNATPETLQQIASSKEQWVCDAVAFNPNAPAELLHKLLDKSLPDRLLALACNPALPLELQLEIARVGDDRIKWQLADTAENEKVWQEILNNTPNQKEHPWRSALAKALDPKTKAPTLNHLQRSLDTRHFFINKIAARHANAAKDLCSNFAYYLFDQLAQNPMRALQLLEDPQAIRPAPYLNWKVDQWLTEGTAPGMVANYFLEADALNNKRRALNCWAASLRLVQQQAFATDTLLLKKLAQRKDITRFVFEVLSRSDKPSVREEVAKNPACPGEVVHRLKQDKVAAVRATAAEHPAASVTLHATSAPNPETIAKLANKGPKKDRIKLADRTENHEILVDLANDKAAEVRLAVAYNKFTSARVLEQLAGDADESVRSAVAYHDLAALETIKRLLLDASAKVRSRALGHSIWNEAQSYSQDDESGKYRDRESLLSAFYCDPEIIVRRVVAEYTNNHEVQLEYTREMDVMLLTCLAHNTHLCEAAIQILSEHQDPKVRSEVAPLIRDIKVLEYLLSDEDEHVVLMAARSLGITSYCQAREKYADHPNPHVRKLISRLVNECDTVEVYLKLLQDPNAVCHQSLTSNSHLPVNAREFILVQQHPELIKQLVCQSRLSEEEQKTLCLNGSIEIREILAENTELESVQQALVEDPAVSVRKHLACNVCLPPKLRSILKKDADSEVRLFARMV